MTPRNVYLTPQAQSYFYCEFSHQSKHLKLKPYNTYKGYVLKELMYSIQNKPYMNYRLNFSKYGADFDIFKVKLDKVINEIHFKDVNFISDF